MNWTGSPLGAAVTLDDLAPDPYPAYARLRAAEPISWVPALGGWVVTRRDLAEEVLLDWQHFASATGGNTMSTVQRTFGTQMLSVDGDEHHRHRAPFNPPFRFRAVHDSIAATVEHEVHQLIDGFVDLGATELSAEFATRVAVAVIGAVLGVPDADRNRLRGWYDAFAASLANVADDREVHERGLRTVGEFRHYALSEIARLRVEPDDSLIAAVATDDGCRLDDAEIAANLLLVLFGGIETTESSILNTTWALLSHPDALSTVRTDPSLLEAAVEESLRWEAPVQLIERFATTDLTFAGCPIKAGEPVSVAVGAANRDPDHSPDPDRFDPARANARDHLSFARGPHLCLGLHLARLETITAVGALLARLGGLHLDTRRPSAPRGTMFRRPPHLHVLWKP